MTELELLQLWKLSSFRYRVGRWGAESEEAPLSAGIVENAYILEKRKPWFTHLAKRTDGPVLFYRHLPEQHSGLLHAEILV